MSIILNSSNEAVRNLSTKRVAMMVLLGLAVIGSDCAVARDRNAANCPANVEKVCSKESSESRLVQGSSNALRFLGKCAQSQSCRKEVAERASRIAVRAVRLANEILFNGAEQLYELLGDLTKRPDNREVLAVLDRLEILLKQNQLQCSDLQHEIETLRTIYR